MSLSGARVKLLLSMDAMAMYHCTPLDIERVGTLSSFEDEVKGHPSARELHFATPGNTQLCILLQIGKLDV